MLNTRSLNGLMPIRSCVLPARQTSLCSFQWIRNMRTHFKDYDIHNAICQSEVATTTFTKNARNWWDAHCLKRPTLLVIYDQLQEWIRHELVSDSNPALA